MVSVEIHIDVVDLRRGVVDRVGERTPTQPDRVGSVVGADVPGEVDVVAAALQLEPEEGDLDSVALLNPDVPFLPQTVAVSGAAGSGIGAVAVYEAVVTEGLNP